MHDFRSRIDDTHTQVVEAHGGMFIRDPSGNGLVLQPEGS
jgi:hypothetical protein